MSAPPSSSSTSFSTLTSSRNVMAVGGVVLLASSAVGLYFLHKKWQETRTGDNRAKYPFLSDYDITLNKLREIEANIISEMERGLTSKQLGRSSLKMLPSFVGKPTGQEKGHFYALDLGGTNFRVIRLELRGDGTLGENRKQQFSISEEAMKGTSEQLFDFIADSVKTFLSREEGGNNANDNNNNNRRPLGFTFSFPVEQTSVNAGTLIHWTKGFTTSGVEGKDVVALLNEAFRRKNVNAEILALANDTVGTMVARGYEDSKCEMGVILGTGTNACYAEQLSNITKFSGNVPKGIGGMIINMEWGAFGDHTNFLPRTSVDKELDLASLNPKKQLFEKMISGMYLGEIVRYLLIELIEKQQLFGKVLPTQRSSLTKPYSFPTSHISDVLGDKSASHDKVETIFTEHFGFAPNSMTEEDRNIVHEACRMVALRAARLSAVAIGAVLSKINRLTNASVAVDGGVFEHLPGFKEKMDETLKELYPDSSIRLVLTKDGSGIGAAVIAATVATS